MAEIIMPKMGDAMTEGKVIQWYKKPGDAVNKGEPVLEIETDKVNLDLEAEESGVLGPIRVEAGEVAEVGKVLATLGEEGEAAEPEPARKKKAKPSAPEEPATEEPATEEPATEEPEKPEPAEPSEVPEEKEKPKERKVAPKEPASPAEPDRAGFVRSSPLARRMASELGVDLGAVRGSGPGGRIVAEDVRKASVEAPEAKPAPAARIERVAELPPLERKEIPLTAMRRTIAKRLSESTGPIPHFYLTIELDVTDLLGARGQLNEVQPVKTSVNDFVVRASALALRHHPNVNASFEGDSIVQHGEVHVGIAVATPAGLLTPVVRNADRKSVPEIADEVRDLAERARNRKLKPNEYEGSTLTISNLGMYGIEEFTAIINPPNSAILAVGAAGPKPVVAGREIVVRDRMRITMSCDHRVVDGAAGAEYLRTLRQYLEQPLRVLLS